MREGWVTKNLGAITTKIGSGATPRGGKETYQKQGIALIRSMNVYDCEFAFENLAFLNDNQADQLSNVVVRSGDVLLNITGASVARCCQVPTKVLPARVNQHVSIIRPIPEVIDSNFLTYLLTSRACKDRLLETGEKAGATRQAITKAQLQDFPVTFPASISEQQRIVAILDETFAGLSTATANAEKNLKNARELFESYLGLALSQAGGRWPVRRLDETVDENCSLSYGIVQPGDEEAGGLPIVRPVDMTTKIIRADSLKRIDASLAKAYSRTTR